MQQVVALDSSVLVLNKFFMALHVISARRAFALLCKASAEVISVDDGKFSSYNFESWMDISLYKAKSGLPDVDRGSWVRTVSLEIEIPKIIRLLFYDKLPQSNVKFNRRNILHETRINASTVVSVFQRLNSASTIFYQRHIMAKLHGQTSYVHAQNAIKRKAERLRNRLE